LTKTKNGRRYYDHSLIKIEALDRFDNQAPTLTNKNVQQLRAYISPASGHLAGEESTVNILKKHLGVNTKK
jgi:hypothetical protein